MKQLIQNLKNGHTLLEEVPAPKVKSGHLLIQTTRSLVSLGTERMLVEFGKASLVGKARQEPDRVKQVLDKIKSDGLLPTLESVFNKLNQPLPLGYCNVGRVIEIGTGVSGFKIGDRVASNGHHAEYVCIPQNLACRIPENVSDEEATFTVIGSIGLQGIRLVNPTLGETVVVIGLGLIGLVTAELLMADGCRVIGFDYDEQKIELARKRGVLTLNLTSGSDPVKYVEQVTAGVGADAVIITASDKSDQIIHQAASMSRMRGRIVLVGVVGLNILREDFYKKELSFQVSCSYGPGRYDEEYEQKGRDYPLHFVRWTEKRNFEAILNAIFSKRLHVAPLITERVSLENYLEIYGQMGKKRSIASILVYPEDSAYKTKVDISEGIVGKKGGKMGIIGAGNFTGSTIIPSLLKANAPVKTIASAGGLSAKILARKGKIPSATTNYNDILEDEEISLVIITTRHHLHAKMTVEAMMAGKHVFVEKPLCITNQELEQIIEAKNNHGPDLTITVGFNRRFSPHAMQLKKLLGEGPINIIATMNAGFLPPELWVQDMEVGGGRIIGEACHYIDLCSFLAGSRVTQVCMNGLGIIPEENTDNASILLRYENGTNAVINYFSNGSKAYSKERIEVFAREQVFIIQNWRKLTAYGLKGFSGSKTRQDKGHQTQFSKLTEVFRTGGDPLIPFEEIVNTTRASFAAIQSLKENRWVEVG